MRRGKTGQKQPLAQKFGRDNISIVLMEPRSPGNIGSVARAMMNNGFKSLQLVNPCDFKNNVGYSMACKADGMLLGAEVFANAHDCVERSAIVVGATRRKGRIRHPVLTLDEAVPRLLELSATNKVAILFGREDRGLTNEEILLCDILFEIPSDDGYPSLNLSHAVFIVCYSLFKAVAPPPPAIIVAPRTELDGMYEHLEAALRALGYGDAGGEHLLTTILRNSKRLFGRAGLMRKEVNMLRGIFTQIIERTRT